MTWGGSKVLGVVAYDPVWATLFEALGCRLREALGEVALRIDHIGSTAVPGLDAEPIIDVQISVASLEPVAAFLGPIQSCGFVWRRDNTELTKRYFREAPGARRTHIHVRPAGRSRPGGGRGPRTPELAAVTLPPPRSNAALRR